MKRLVSLVILAVLAALALRCGGDGLIASGGDFFLHIDDLRYEISRLGPNASYRDTHEDRLAVVEKLAARHYLAREAEARGYGDELLEEAVSKKVKLAAAEAYRRWRVEGGIRIPRVQRVPWLAKLDRRLHLIDLQFMVYEVAREAQDELEAGRSFESLAAEAAGRQDIRVSDMGWRVWKELDLAVSNVVFRLDVEEVSPIVFGADGYHLFYLVEAAELGISGEIQSLRSKKFLTAMKEEELLKKERAELVRKYDVTFKDEGVAAALKTFALSFQGERPADELMGEVVATYPESRLVVGDLFSAYYSVANDSRPYVGDRHGIEEAAIDLMMPELEALAAFDMGMGRSRDVMWAKRAANEDYLVLMMEDYFRSGIVVTEQDLEEYYEARKLDLRNPARYKASRILASTAADAGQALRRLMMGDDFLQVAREISEAEPRAEKSGELDWINVGTIAVFDSAIAELDPGEMTGVFESGSGFEILRLDDREEAVYLSYEEAVPSMKVYISNTRANEVLAEWVEQRKREVGYHIDEDLLRNSTFPAPDYLARRMEIDERQEDPRESVLPKMERW